MDNSRPFPPPPPPPVVPVPFPTPVVAAPSSSFSSFPAQLQQQQQQQQQQLQQQQLQQQQQQQQQPQSAQINKINMGGQIFPGPSLLGSAPGPMTGSTTAFIPLPSVALAGASQHLLNAQGQGQGQLQGQGQGQLQGQGQVQGQGVGRNGPPNPNLNPSAYMPSISVPPPHSNPVIPMHQMGTALQDPAPSMPRSTGVSVTPAVPAAPPKKVRGCLSLQVTTQLLFYRESSLKS
jgi:hypothetical protein